MIKIGQLTLATAIAAEQLDGLLAQLGASDQKLTLPRLISIMDSGTRIYVATDANSIVGTASLIVVDHIMRTKCWVEDVVVDKAYLNQGIGRRLLEQVIADAPSNASSVKYLTSDDRAVNLNSSLGFADHAGIGF